MKVVLPTIISAALFLAMLATVGYAKPLTIFQLRPLALTAQSQNPENEETLQIFSGTVIPMASGSGMLVLKEDVKGSLYGLDNQGLARQFADKKVSVTGTLDKMRTIHIKNIEEQKIQSTRSDVRRSRAESRKAIAKEN